MKKVSSEKVLSFIVDHRFELVYFPFLFSKSFDRKNHGKFGLMLFSHF